MQDLFINHLSVISKQTVEEDKISHALTISLEKSKPEIYTKITKARITYLNQEFLSGI